MVFLKYSLIILGIIAVLAIIAAYNQEKLIFFPQKLPPDYQFSFPYHFKEQYIPVDKKTKIHGLLFQTQNPRGLVFYLHGNAGSNSSWGTIAGDYLENGYDFFIPDYRGYGKSEGKISGEHQFFRDLQIAYDTMKTNYPENQMVIIGYSIGTGPATYLASVNNPRLLILKAPYYNLPDLATRYFKIFPPFMIRYKFRTDKYIQEVKCPVVIFHGDEDEVIYAGSSLKLRQKFKPTDSLIILKNQRHNGMNENPVYLEELKKLLHP